MVERLGFLVIGHISALGSNVILKLIVDGQTSFIVSSPYLPHQCSFSFHNHDVLCLGSCRNLIWYVDFISLTLGDAWRLFTSCFWVDVKFWCNSLQWWIVYWLTYFASMAPYLIVSFLQPKPTDTLSQQTTLWKPSCWSKPLSTSLSLSPSKN